MLLKLAWVCSALQEQQTLEQIFTQIKNYSRTFWGFKSEKITLTWEIFDRAYWLR